MKEMKTYTFLCLLLFLGAASCSINKWNKSLLRQGGSNAAITNAILDFVNTSKWSKKDSVFLINYRIVLSW